MVAKVEGVRALERKLKELSDLDRGKVLRAGANAAGQLIVRDARATVPVGSVPHKTYKGRWVGAGFLKRSVKKTTRVHRGKTDVTVRIGVKNEAFYGVQFLELGTSKHPRRPWLRTAFKRNRRKAVDIMRQRMLEHIDKVARKR